MFVAELSFALTFMVGVKSDVFVLLTGFVIEMIGASVSMFSVRAVEFVLLSALSIASTITLYVPFVSAERVNVVSVPLRIVVFCMTCITPALFVIILSDKLVTIESFTLTFMFGVKSDVFVLLTGFVITTVSGAVVSILILSADAFCLRSALLPTSAKTSYVPFVRAGKVNVVSVAFRIVVLIIA